MRILILLLLLATPTLAVEPDEILDDPALEARARQISTLLRCPVCRNENIDNSNAEIAGDLRLLVRERLSAGDSDQQVLDFIVAKYNEYVLLKPPLQSGNLMLWAAGPLMLVIGAGLALVFIRRRPRQESEPLNTEEAKRLAALLEE